MWIVAKLLVIDFIRDSLGISLNDHVSSQTFARQLPLTTWWSGRVVVSIPGKQPYPDVVLEISISTLAIVAKRSHIQPALVFGRSNPSTSWHQSTWLSQQLHLKRNSSGKKKLRVLFPSVFPLPKEKGHYLQTWSWTPCCLGLSYQISTSSTNNDHLHFSVLEVNKQNARSRKCR